MSRTRREISIGAVALTMLLAAGRGAEAAGANCRIQAFVSKVEISRGSVIVPIRKGLQLEQADRFTTGAKGRVHILCDEKATIVIGGDTQITFSQLKSLKSSDGILVRIFKGIAGFIRPIAGKGRFEVRTPNAVASVRSTEWTVDTAPEGTAVFVREGAVQVTGLGGAAGQVLLRQGDGAEVAPDGAVSPSSQWPPARIARMNARLGYDWK